MHLKAKSPIFVPEQFCSEIEKLSKAALMDLVWDYATRCASGNLQDDVMAEFRKSAKIIVLHRKHTNRSQMTAPNAAN